VLHYTELLQELVREGRLNLRGAAAQAGKVVIHDSCYLGRHNGLYDPPRDLVARATGRAPVELERSREKGFCCGAGGGRMWMEEDPDHRVNLERVREALAATPDRIAVSCPYCLTMFEDGVKDLHAAGKVRVADVAELLAERLGPG
jgi:Fe-S oxidoreductase